MSIDIQKLRELLAKATQGPWTAQGGFVIPANGLNRFDAIASFINCDGPTAVNRDLVIAAVNSLPALIDEIEALRKSNTECIEEINEMSHNCNDFKSEIEALRKQCSADGFVSVEDVKVKLPERHWHHDVGHFYDSEEVIDAITAANVEIES